MVLENCKKIKTYIVFSVHHISIDHRILEFLYFKFQFFKKNFKRKFNISPESHYRQTLLDSHGDQTTLWGKIKLTVRYSFIHIFIQLQSIHSQKFISIENTTILISLVVSKMRKSHRFFGFIKLYENSDYFIFLLDQRLVKLHWNIEN